MKNVLVLTFVVLVVSSSTNVLVAHDCFKEPLEERYNLKTVSCKSCHPNSKDKSIHNKLGIMLEKQLKGLDLTKKFFAAEEKGEEAKAAYEKEMVVEFKKAMVEVEKKQLTIKDMIEFGLFNGMRLNDKGEEVANAKLAAEKEGN